MRAVQSCQFRQPTLRVLRDRSPTNVAVVAWQRLIGWSQFDLPDVHPAGLLVDPFGLTPKSRTASDWGALLTGCSPRHMPLAAITAAPCATTMSVNAKPPEDSHSLIVENFIACPISSARIYGSFVNLKTRPTAPLAAASCSWSSSRSAISSTPSLLPSRAAAMGSASNATKRNPSPQRQSQPLRPNRSSFALSFLSSVVVISRTSYDFVSNLAGANVRGKSAGGMI
jgi:hypothetical protein